MIWLWIGRGRSKKYWGDSQLLLIKDMIQIDRYGGHELGQKVSRQKCVILVGMSALSCCPTTSCSINLVVSFSSISFTICCFMQLQYFINVLFVVVQSTILLLSIVFVIFCCLLYFHYIFFQAFVFKLMVLSETASLQQRQR